VTVEPVGPVAAGVDPRTAAAVVDLGAFSRNIRRLHDHIDRTIMVVVKADGYGHGMITCARAARQAGADWLGTATPTEAVRVRRSGDLGRLLCWLYGPDEDLSDAVAADIDITLHRADQLSMIRAAVATAGRPARVQLKIDTGLSRNGSSMEAWPELCRQAHRAETDGTLTVTGIWSHFAAADEPGHPSISAQLEVYAEALRVAEAAGLQPEVRHIANSAAALTVPQARYDLVRLGIACYGVEPGPGIAAGVGVDLEPVMTLRAQLVAVKAVAAGVGVSYGHTWIADQDTVVGLVPLGYGDGIPVAASNCAEVQVGGRRAPIRGRVCMDQFVVDLGPTASDRVGDEVIVFSRADAGPTAEEWAAACHTIGYEIITRIGGRVPRVYR
jgi:alanine racemase